MSVHTRRTTVLFASAVVAVLLSLSVPARDAQGAEVVVSEEEALRHGRVLFTSYCAGCHGAKGDGRGPAAPMLIVKPRDFTSGMYKFRSTPNGTLPTDADLMRTITRGVNRTSMPEWSLLPERERMALVVYVKSFYPPWNEQGAGTPIFIPKPPGTLGSPASVARGRELYEMLECGRCHGAAGKGDGPSAATLSADSWGNPQKPFDFTKGALKSGAAAEDVYRTFMTGLNGTAMPSYADVFDEPDGESIHPGDAWNLVSYILSLRTEGRRPAVATEGRHPAVATEGRRPSAPSGEARRGPDSPLAALGRALRARSSFIGEASAAGEAFASDKEPLP